MKSRFLACAAADSALSDFLRLCEKGGRKGSSPAGSGHTYGARSASTTGARAKLFAACAQAASSTPSRLPDAATRARIQDLLNRIQDAYFDYNKHTLRPDAEAALKKDAQTWPTSSSSTRISNSRWRDSADERGSDEYNMALGDARAKQTKEYLSNLGLPGNQLATISYGKEKPVCTEHDEECWQKNRRTHITQAQAN